MTDATPRRSRTATASRTPKKILRLARTTAASWSTLELPADDPNRSAVEKILKACATVERRETAARAALLEARAAKFQKAAEALRASAEAAKAATASDADDDAEDSDKGAAAAET